MRGSDERPGSLFSYVDLEDRTPASQPPRKIRAIVNKALSALDAGSRSFTRPMAGRRLRLSGFCGWP